MMSETPGNRRGARARTQTPKAAAASGNSTPRKTAAQRKVTPKKQPSKRRRGCVGERTPNKTDRKKQTVETLSSLEWEPSSSAESDGVTGTTDPVSESDGLSPSLLDIMFLPGKHAAAAAAGAHLQRSRPAQVAAQPMVSIPGISPSPEGKEAPQPTEQPKPPLDELIRRKTPTGSGESARYRNGTRPVRQKTKTLVEPMYQRLVRDAHDMIGSLTSNAAPARQLTRVISFVDVPVAAAQPDALSSLTKEETAIFTHCIFSLCFQKKAEMAAPVATPADGTRQRKASKSIAPATSPLEQLRSKFGEGVSMRAFNRMIRYILKSLGIKQAANAGRNRARWVCKALGIRQCQFNADHNRIDEELYECWPEALCRIPDCGTCEFKGTRFPL